MGGGWSSITGISVDLGVGAAFHSRAIRSP
jgi:hypothetical protein